MKELPDSETYKQEFEYMPWGILIKEILAIIEKEIPKNGKVIDLMCGPGYLLGEIAKRKSDLYLEGVDISEEFINHARENYPFGFFQTADVLAWNWNKGRQYDLVICTGGIHHLPYEKQVPFIEKIPSILKNTGFCILADPFIDNFSNEADRKKAAAKLGYEYIVATIENGAPDSIIQAAVDILHNDVMGFEFKNSIERLTPELKRIFSNFDIKKTWPKSRSGYGDYYIIGRK